MTRRRGFDIIPPRQGRFVWYIIANKCMLVGVFFLSGGFFHGPSRFPRKRFFDRPHSSTSHPLFHAADALLAAAGTLRRGGSGGGGPLRLHGFHGGSGRGQSDDGGGHRRHHRADHGRDGAHRQGCGCPHTPGRRPGGGRSDPSFPGSHRRTDRRAAAACAGHDTLDARPCRRGGGDRGLSSHLRRRHGLCGRLQRDQRNFPRPWKLPGAAALRVSGLLYQCGVGPVPGVGRPSGSRGRCLGHDPGPGRQRGVLRFVSAPPSAPLLSFPRRHPSAASWP